MRTTKTIQVPYNFEPRGYQAEIFNVFPHKYKRADLVWHRRGGKDKVSVAIVAREAVKVKGIYYYVLPLQTQGRAALWDNIDKSGFNTIEHIPKELWAKKNDQEMKLTLTNGSIVKVIGSKDVNNIVGTNPRGIVFSEWSLQAPITWDYLLPILVENGGWALFNYTPRGENHAKKFHEYAIASSDWFSSTKTVDDTSAIPPEDIEATRREYLTRYGNTYLFDQEFFCSFDSPVIGSVYGEVIAELEKAGSIGAYAYDTTAPVYTVWDLGVGDSTAIWFFQLSGNVVTFIDYYEMYNAGLKHYVDRINEKRYTYAGHILPHDGANKIQAKEELPETRQQMLETLGLRNVIVAPREVDLLDGIERTRGKLSRCRFDKEKCSRGITALREYHRSWKESARILSAYPEHDWSSHAADAMRVGLSYIDKLETRWVDPNTLRQNTFVAMS